MNDQVDLLNRLRCRLDPPATVEAEFALGDEQHELLAERLAEYHRDPVDGEPWAVVEARLRSTWPIK